jgi:hypothetical protein
MYDFLIKEYISNMTKNDVVNFAKNQGITLTENETDIIYYYIKNHWKTLYYGNPDNILKDLKSKISGDTYNKFEKLYIEVKNKIS